MPKEDLFLRYLHRLFPEETTLTDRHLLERFLDTRDESAFTHLVHRHGAMVLNVCQSVLRHRQEAEDALQATFLILARRAKSIRLPECLASWLHGVARRVSLKARAGITRRRQIESTANPVQAVLPTEDLGWSEVQAILHEELEALPEHWRAAVVLCYLQGLTQDEAARRLGWTATTLKGRLQQARELLRRRLERRGLDVASALGTMALACQASETLLPRALKEAAVRLALAGKGATATTAAGLLAKSVLKSYVGIRLVAATGLVLMAVALTGGIAFIPGQPEGKNPAPPAPPLVRNQSEPKNDSTCDPLPEGAIARLGTLRFNHGAGLESLLFSPDGKTIISQGQGHLRLWETASGIEIKNFSLPGFTGAEQTILAPDGKTLVSFGLIAHDTLRFWDFAQGKEVRRVVLPVHRQVSSVYFRNALSPDGRLCAVNMQEGLQVFEVATARELFRLPGDKSQTRPVVFAGNDRLVTAGQGNKMEVFEAATGKPLLKIPHDHPIGFLTASTDGRWLAALEHHCFAVDRQLDRDVIHVWDLSTPTRKFVLEAPSKGWFYFPQFSPDSKFLFGSLAGSSKYQLFAWDVRTGRRSPDLKGATGWVLAVSPDGTKLVEGAGPGSCRLWDLKTGQPISSGDREHARAGAIFLSPNGDRVLTLGRRPLLSTWDGNSGRRLNSFALPPHLWGKPLFSPNGRFALTVSGYGEKPEAPIWDVTARVPLFALHPPPTSYAFSPDSSTLATWSGMVRLYDVRTGREVQKFHALKVGWPGTLFFEADGKTLIIAGRQVVGWNVASGQELFSWGMKQLMIQVGEVKELGLGKPMDPEERIPWRNLTFSSDGRWMACILSGIFGPDPVSGRIALCRARTGQILRRWGDSGKPSSSWEQLAFSPDNRLLATSDGDVIHLWETITGKEVQTFRGHRGDIESLTFSANGRRLASASWDSTVLLWGLTACAPGEQEGAKDPGEKEITSWWHDLGGNDARRAQAAVWRLVEVPTAALPFLRRHLKPVTEDEIKKAHQQIEALDHDSFAVREKASEELSKLGVTIAPLLKEALQKNPSPEVRRRLEQLLENHSDLPGSGEPLRFWRALAVLEHAGTPEAKALLQTLAGGAPQAWQTQEARAVLQRIGVGSGASQGR